MKIKHKRAARGHATYRLVTQVGVVGVEGDGLNVVGMREPGFRQRTNGHVVEVIWKVKNRKVIHHDAGK